MKEIVVDLITGSVSLAREEIFNLVEVPPKLEMGDYAFPCFSLAKKLKKNPLAIAEDLVEKFRRNLPKEISGVDFKGGYVNFFIDKKYLVEKVLNEVKSKSFGKLDFGKGKKVVIDMSSPNIAKPFGVGHLRSTIIGNSIAKISESCGFNAVKINYLGDWGTQFGKLIYAFKQWGDEKKLKEKPTEYLQELYVKVNSDKKYEEFAREEFKKLEEGDEENLKLWQKFRKMSLKKFEEIYDLLGVDFDVVSGESDYNGRMDSVISLLKKKKLLKKDDGAEIVDLSKDNLGVALIQKSDGTSLYATRDLAAAIDRQKKYGFDKLIYEVGQEQTLHFKQVFKILELLGFAWAKDCVHVSHGLYLGKDGKKFSTRKGKTVYMMDVFEETFEKAKKNLQERENKLSKKEIENRALSIAVAAIFYGDLKNSLDNNIIFDIDKMLAFEGDTGPYLLYSYARASSIIRRVKGKKKVKVFDLHDEEIALIKKIDSFSDVLKRSYEHLAPNLVANYSFELAQIFNEFYHACPVLGSKEEGLRLALVDAFRITLKKVLELLGIGVLEEM